MLLLLLTLLLSSTLPPAAAADGRPLPRDTTVETSSALRARLLLIPRPLWSRTSGFGAGAGLRLEQLVLSDDRLELTVWPQQHLGQYVLYYATADPFAAPVYGSVAGTFETHGRQWFYGLGPATQPGTMLAVEKKRWEAELTFGLQWRRGLLHAHPFLRYSRHHVEDVREWQAGAFEALSPASRANVLFAAGDPASGYASATATQEGLWYGLTLGYDSRDARMRPSRGLLAQATVRRFAPIGALDLRFDRYEVRAHAFLPLGPGSVAAVRAAAARTHDRGSVPVPFYLLPGLGPALQPGLAWDRFFGSDLLALSIEYRRLLFDVLGIVGLEGTLSLHAANVYDDLFAQFAPRIDFDGEVAAGRDRYPLRPALGIGARIVSLFDDAVYLQGTLALTPEGLGAAGFGFVYDLREPGTFPR